MIFLIFNVNTILISQSSSLLYKDITKSGIIWQNIPFTSDCYEEKAYHAEETYLSKYAVTKCNVND